MNDSPIVEYDQSKWNRRLLNGFWLSLLLYIAVEFIYMANGIGCQSVLLHLVRPVTLLVAVTLMAEAGVRYLPKHHEYILISSAAISSIVVAELNSTETYLLFVLFYPVLISGFFLQLPKLLFAVAASLLSFGAIYFYSDNVRVAATPGATAGILSSILLFSALMIALLLRIAELVRHLRASYEEREEQRRLLAAHADDPFASDPLTGTGSHSLFHEELDRLVEEFESDAVPLHLAFVNLDRFRMANAAFGYPAGDRVLRNVARVLSAQAGNAIVARYGGDEFALLLVGSSDREAFELTERIRMAIFEAPQPALNGGCLSVSAGLASYAAGLGREALLRHARSALREAKMQGRNRTKIAPASVRSPLQVR